MKTYCVKDFLTGHVFKVLFTEDELEEFLNQYPEIKECSECIECDDAPSLYIE